MIPVELEDTEELAKWGMGLEHMIEACFFCKTPTRYWNNKANQPCCPSCAKTHRVAEFKGKVTGTSKESAMSKGQSLEQFVKEVNGDIVAFKRAYERKHVENPEHYPLMLGDDNDGLWLEFFMTFLQTGKV